jgi:hypothetical protein
LPILQVAGIALRREAIEPAGGKLLVALIALHGGMRAKKREAVLVIFYLLHRHIPSLHRVALCAIWSHLAAVNVRVAIRAILSYIRKHRFAMARNALYLFMHTTQGVVGLVVVEFRHRADRPPAGRGVTVFAGDREWAVWISRRLFLGGASSRMRGRDRPLCAAGKRREKDSPESELE